MVQTSNPESNLTFTCFAQVLYLDRNNSLILERPWLKQCNPMIDWPTYSLDIKGKVLVGKRKELIQLVSPQELKSLVRNSSSMLGVILVRPQTNALTSTSHAILKEFMDVFREQLPDELPPQRPIQHQIDFFPDKPAVCIECHLLKCLISRNSLTSSWNSSIVFTLSGFRPVCQEEKWRTPILYRLQNFEPFDPSKSIPSTEHRRFD